MYQGQRALITGASGFIGSHLADYLNQKGFKIWGSLHRTRKNLSLPVRWIRANLTHREDALNLVRRARPDYLFHFAGQAVPGQSWEDPGTTLRVNVVAPIYLFEAVRRYAPKCRILVMSSSHVYGTTFLARRRVRETDPVSPLNPYGGSKLLMEMAAMNFVKQHGLDIVIVRGFNQVGTGQKPDFAFANFCRQVALMEKRRKPLLLRVGNRDVVRDFLYIRDAVRAYLTLVRKGKRGEIYNIGSGKGTSLKAVIKFLKRISGLHFRVLSEKARRQRKDLPWIVCDPSKLRALGWRSEGSIWEGLQKILAECRQEAN